MTTHRGTRETLAFFTTHVAAPPARVLDVGCGDGDLACALANQGYDVVGIDPDESAVEKARGRGVDATAVGLHEFEASPFDAIVCSRSLHHVEGLDEAATRLRSLLREGGHLVVEEFDVEGVEEATAAWNYGMRAVIATTGTGLGIELDEGHAVLPDAPLSEWEHDHAHEGGLHSGARIAAAIDRSFGGSLAQQAPYLYRYFIARMPNDGLRESIGELVYAMEVQAIELGMIRAVGRRFVARK